MTPSGIELPTFLSVAQHLNHCATAVPPIFLSSVWNSYDILFVDFGGKFNEITGINPTVNVFIPKHMHMYPVLFISDLSFPFYKQVPIVRRGVHSRK
jgi:hypothetical protein